MFLIQSMPVFILVALLSLCQTVWSLAFTPPVRAASSKTTSSDLGDFVAESSLPAQNGNGQITDRLEQNATYTFRWENLSNATLTTIKRVRQSHGTIISTERTIERNISTLGLAPFEYWNWTYTVTEPLNSNLTVAMEDTSGFGMSAVYLVAETDAENLALGRPAAGLWAVGASVLVISTLMI